MTTYTPQQLLTFKFLIVEYCKDRIEIESYLNEPTRFLWDETGVEILDTEWAKIVNDVELGLDDNMWYRYWAKLETLCWRKGNKHRQEIVATWPQRVDAMQRAGMFEKK